MNNIGTYRIVGIWVLGLLLAACAGEPYAGTPVEALAGFPRLLTPAALESAELLHEQQVADGAIFLYRYQAEGTACLATAFVVREQGQRWQAQSASVLDCERETSAARLLAGYTVNGRFTSVYGLAQTGQSVLVEWSDGRASLVTLQNGVFLETRSGKLTALRFELLDADGNVLEIRDGRNGDHLLAEGAENAPLVVR